MTFPDMARDPTALAPGEAPWAAPAGRSRVTSVDDLAQGQPRGTPREALDRAALRQIPRTDQLLADPRLAAAELRLGRNLVKAAIGRAQEQARNAEITPGQVADAAA